MASKQKLVKKTPKTKRIGTKPKSRPPYNYKGRNGGISTTEYMVARMLGGDGVHDPWVQKYSGDKIPIGYTPHMRSEPVHVTKTKQGFTTRKFTPDEKKRHGTFGIDRELDVFTGAISRQNKIIYPRYHQNPYLFNDMIYFQDMYANTICGRVIDMLASYALANGVKPEIRIRHESSFKSDEEREKALESHKWMVDVLEEIDKNVSTSSTPKSFKLSGTKDYTMGSGSNAKAAPDQPVYDSSLKSKWQSSFINTMIFGRCILVPQVDPNDNAVKVFEDGKEIEYKYIPKIMLPIHPRDIGFNYIDYETHRLLGVQLNNSHWIQRPDEMIFWENKPNNPVYGSKYYGMSECQSMMGSSRTLRKILEVDLPTIASTRWAGMYIMFLKRKGLAHYDQVEEINGILSNLELAGINVLMEDDPQNDANVVKLDTDPKIDELGRAAKDAIQYIIAQVGMPQGILYGEADLNRDTFYAKIHTWTNGPLKNQRGPFLEAVTNQWYRRMCATLAEQSKKWAKALKQFEIFATVDEYRLEQLDTKIDSLIKLENITGKWKVDAMSDYLEMPGLAQKIDPDADPMDLPQMPTNKNVSVTDKQTGKEFGVSA